MGSIAIIYLSSPAAAVPTRPDVSITGQSVNITYPSAPTGGNVELANWNGAKAVLEPTQTVSMQASQELSVTSTGGARTSVVFATNASGIIVERAVYHLDSGYISKNSRQPPLQWVETQDAVQMSWASPSPDIRWTVRRDGEVIANETAATHYSDVSADRAVAHSYTVTGEQSLMVNGQRRTKPFYFEMHTPEFDTTSIGMAADDPERLGAQANADIGYVSDRGAFQVNYATFIPEEFVESNLFCTVTSQNPEIAFFAGDGRGFDQSDFSGSLPARLLLSRSGAFYDGVYTPNALVKRTGDTRAYDKDYNLVATKNAGTGGLTEHSIQNTSSYNEGTFEMHVADPLCPGAPAIDSVMYHREIASGEMRIKGDHDQAPSHEVTLLWWIPRDVGRVCV